VAAFGHKQTLVTGDVRWVHKRFVGVVAAIRSASPVFISIPLSNGALALVIALIALNYLEEDGLLLLISNWPPSSC
jgi:hypothetical protein